MISSLCTLILGYQLADLPTQPVSPVSLADASGVVRRIPTAQKATVLFFVATDCPIANRMAPELSRIVKSYQPKGVSFLFVYVEPSQTKAQILGHLKEYKLRAPGILDAKHQLVKMSGATVTPQAVVFSKAGKMVYRGRINDLFLEHGRSRKAPKTEDLKNALNQFLAGKPIAVPQTPALGCSIPPLG